MRYIYAEQAEFAFPLRIKVGGVMLCFDLEERTIVEAVMRAMAPYLDSVEFRELYEKLRITHSKKEEH